MFYMHVIYGNNSINQIHCFKVHEFNFSNFGIIVLTIDMLHTIDISLPKTQQRSAGPSVTEVH